MSAVKTTDLCDARPDIAVVQLPFAHYGRRLAFAGAARTLRYAGGLATVRDLLHSPGAGCVLVIDGEGAGWHALFGDRMAEIAARYGWEGVVLNGLLRDAIEIDGMDIGVKALGTVPRRAEIGSAGESGLPVQIGGVAIAPGQRIVADRDGVVVLPEGLHESQVDTAAAVAATAKYASSTR